MAGTVANCPDSVNTDERQLYIRRLDRTAIARRHRDRDCRVPPTSENETVMRAVALSKKHVFGL